MASLINHRGTYYVQFYSRNRRPQKKQVNLKVTNKRSAQRLKIELEDRFALGMWDPWVSTDWHESDTQSTPITLREGLELFLREKSHLQPTTLKTYEDTLSFFCSTVGDGKAVMTVRADDVREWLEGTSTNDVTKNSYVRDVKHFFKVLIRLGHLDTNPCDDVRVRRVPNTFPKFMTPEEVDTLVRTIEVYVEQSKHHRPGEIEWIIPVIRANVYLGLRRGELVHLRFDQIDFENRTLSVVNTPEFTTKYGKERVIPVAEVPHRILRKLFDARGQNPSAYVFQTPNGKIVADELSRVFKRFVRMSPIGEEKKESLSFHSLRHTACSWLAASGTAPVESIRAFAGHSSYTVTQRYMHLAPHTFHNRITGAFDRVRAP